MNSISDLLIVLGPPGSGKGTQSELLAAKLGYKRIVMGDLIRAFIKGDSAEAKSAKERYDRGIPQPDEVATMLLKRELQSLRDSQGAVFDTFPLSVGQAEALDGIVKELDISKFKVIFLNVGKDEVVKRITGRKICESCKRIYLSTDQGYAENVCPVCGGRLIIRADDTPEIAGKRFEEYEKRNAPIKEHYRAVNALVEVNGEQTVEAVHKEILEKLSLK